MTVSTRMRVSAVVALVVVSLVTMFAAPPASAATGTFTYPTATTIPTSGSAEPYPAPIEVSGFPAPITSVSLTLTGFSHSMPDDVGMVLIAPNGESLLLMDGISSTAPSGTLNLTFSDSAAGYAPDSGALTSGTYKPTAHYTGDYFPPPGPALTYQHPGPAGGNSATFASTFGGDSANGTWKLFIRDFVSSNLGYVNSWSLTITTPGEFAPPVPGTTLTKTPKKKVKTTKKKAEVAFKFTSEIPGVTFECAMDDKAYAPCGAGDRFKVKIGRHTFHVRAVNGASVDPTPAEYSFKVKKKKKKR